MTTAPIRFTRDGSDALEAHLAATCRRVEDGVRALIPADRLEGVLLGGGYGRGEGGVLRTPAGDEPYNDLEFFVFVRGHPVLAERKFRGPLHELGEHLSPDARLEVEFKVLTTDKLRRSEPSMFYYDLVVGHRPIIGDDELLAGCDHHRDPARIPLHEATRLLMNRCSGLLFSAERLARPKFEAGEADFVGRNLAKARLAFGDVVLTAHGRYHWSCQERHRRLAEEASGLDPALPLADLARLHADGVRFKLHPVRSVEPRETLAAQHAELVAIARRLWLWLEERRLGISFPAPRDYAATLVNLCPETSSLRNRLLNARTFGPSAAFAADAARYPRERLLRSLALLLFENAPWTEAASLTRLHRWLDTEALDLPGLVGAYSPLWGRFN